MPGESESVRLEHQRLSARKYIELKFVAAG